MVEEPDRELTTCLAELQYCSSKLDGVLSAVNACVKAGSVRASSCEDLVAVGDILKQYMGEFWEAYNQALRLLHQPSDSEIRTVLEFIERDCQDRPPNAQVL